MAKLYFRYGAMNSGKSTAIIQVAFNYEEKNQKVLLLKPSTDTKGNDNIVNRSGLKRKVDILLKPNDKISKYIKEDIAAILIDEAQFLTTKQVDELYEITKLKKIPVLCYGLRCDFQMKSFPGAERLLAIADDLEELKTICNCGKKATQNLRLINNKPTFIGKQVAIDGKEQVTYESICGECYLKMREQYKKEGEKNAWANIKHIKKYSWS